MQKTVSLPFMLLGILFNVCLVASNLLETKVIQLGPITATAGLIVFPISYIINDCIAEVWGFKKARLIIWSGFAMNFLTIGFARLAITLHEQNEGSYPGEIFFSQGYFIHDCRGECRLTALLSTRFRRTDSCSSFTGYDSHTSSFEIPL